MIIILINKFTFNIKKKYVEKKKVPTGLALIIINLI